MPPDEGFALVETALGWVGLARSRAGLTRLNLPLASRGEAKQRLGAAPELSEEPGRFGDLPARVMRYFAGEVADFADDPDLSACSAFSQAVYRCVQTIPYGATESYAGVARAIGRPRAYRAVGSALAHNPACIVVPCHRVICADGGLHGFGGGLDLKARLLGMEEARLRELTPFL